MTDANDETYNNYDDHGAHGLDAYKTEVEQLREELAMVRKALATTLKKDEAEIMRLHNRANRAEKEQDAANAVLKERYDELERLRDEVERLKEELLEERKLRIDEIELYKRINERQKR